MTSHHGESISNVTASFRLPHSRIWNISFSFKYLHLKSDHYFWLGQFSFQFGQFFFGGRSQSVGFAWPPPNDCRGAAVTAGPLLLGLAWPPNRGRGAAMAAVPLLLRLAWPPNFGIRLCYSGSSRKTPLERLEGIQHKFLM